MTHRAQQIIDAAKALIEARVGPSGTKVYTHRRQSLSPAQDETPAVSVDFGPDEPAEVRLLRGIGSSLSIVVTIKTVAPLEEAAREALLSAREHVDFVMEAAMFAPDGQKLGLSFVHAVRYGGATEPEVDPDGEQFVGELACTWLADYQMR